METVMIAGRWREQPTYEASMPLSGAGCYSPRRPRSRHAQGQPDYSKAEIKTTKLAGNFYTLEGPGGTIGVLTGPDGIGIHGG